MDAYGEEDIPTAFVVDKTGAVVWAGNFLKGLDGVLGKVVAGTYDVKAARATQKAQAARDELVDDYIEQASRRQGAVQATALAERILKEFADDADKLNEFAWAILTNENIIRPDHALALRAAKRAFEVTDGKRSEIVDTYARALFLTGQTNEAITAQQNAVALCDDAKDRLALKETLRDYEHPGADPGRSGLVLDDDPLVRRFVDEMLRLRAEGRTVSLKQMHQATGIAPCAVVLAKPSEQPVDSQQLYERTAPGC